MEIKEENSRRRELSAEPGSWCAATACINGAQAILSPVGFRTSVGYNFDRPPRADVAKLADAPDLGSGFERSGGSSPLIRTKSQFHGSANVRRMSGEVPEASLMMEMYCLPLAVQVIVLSETLPPTNRGRS